MKTPVSPAAYTNAILTVIAIALVLLVVNAYRVDVASPAQAQPAQSYSQSKNLYDLGRPSANTSPGSSRAPVDASNAPMSIDPVSAAAIHEVATANRAIAEAIRELAKAVEGVAGAAKAAQQAPSATGAAGTSGIEVDVR